MLIWRPIMAGKVSIGEVRRAEVTLLDLLKINALLDMQAAAEHAAAEGAQRK